MNPANAPLSRAGWNVNGSDALSGVLGENLCVSAFKSAVTATIRPGVAATFTSGTPPPEATGMEIGYLHAVLGFESNQCEPPNVSSLDRRGGCGRVVSRDGVCPKFAI